MYNSITWPYLYGYEDEVEAEYNAPKEEVKEEKSKKCQCDIQQLFAFGHDKDCPEKK